MKTYWSKFLAGSLILVSISQGSLYAANPFGDEAVNSPTQTQTEPRAGVPAPPPITQTLAEVNGSNAYAPGDYQGYTVSYAVIKATITFDDSTKNAERVAWFQQILSEHGVRTLSLDQKKNQSGNIFNRKKWVSVTAGIEGRGFVVKAIKDYYGGTLSGDPDGFTAAGDPALKALVDLELENRTAELAILQYSFEVDKLIVERSKLGLFDLSAKSRIDKTLKELKETKIPGEKAKIAGNNDKIQQGLSDLAQKALEDKDYQRTIDLVNLARDHSSKATMQVGDAYQGLKQYDKAIEQYQTLTGQAGYAEKAELGLADCQHLKGDDRKALDAIYRILGNFRNSPEELAALAKVDQWKLLDRATEFPEAAGTLTKVYLQKGLLNATSAHSTAIGDYQKAVEIRAAGGNKAEASRQIIAEYSQVKSQYQGQLTSAQDAAAKDFDTRRDRAAGQYEAWRQSYSQAVTRAGTDYDYDLRTSRRSLDDAKSELDYLLRNPPVKPPTSGEGTDPYDNGSDSGSNGDSGTDPYGDNGSNDNSGTDPYDDNGSNGNSGTDPYGNGSNNGSNSNSGTDPYANSGSTGSSGTDPYEEANQEYQDRLEAARAKVDRLQRQYSWLYYNKDAYIADKTTSEKASLDTARAEFERYAVTNRPAYISNNSDVRKYSSLVSEADQRLSTLKGLAKEAGY